MMIRRHQIRTMTALGLAAPLLVGLTLGGASLASADPFPQGATAAEVEIAPRDGEPTDLVTTGSLDFAEPTDSSVTAGEVAEQLSSYAADPALSDSATCDDGLDLENRLGVATCTVIGWSGESETYFAYISPAAVWEHDYALYFAEDTPLSEGAATALNNGSNGTGVYPAFGEKDEVQKVLDPTTAAERANFVLDGIGREDLTVVDVDGEVDLSVPEPVQATAVERASGRAVAVTLLPIPTSGETPGLLVSIDGP